MHGTDFRCHFIIICQPPCLRRHYAFTLFIFESLISFFCYDAAERAFAADTTLAIDFLMLLIRLMIFTSFFLMPAKYSHHSCCHDYFAADAADCFHFRC